tara:strand:+ start:2470 stop:3492 length:1023 start_codon:yes stop_codon:yes gene_type:complete
MKKSSILLMLLATFFTQAQNQLEDLLAAGIEDAQRFATGYISPAAEGLIVNLSNGWVQTANVKKPLKFEIQIIGNVTFVKEEKRSFTLNTNDYNNLYFSDGSTVKEVATAFGENNPDIRVFAVVTDDTGLFEEDVEFNLPQGLASVDMSLLPTAFLQARVGIFKGTEVKFRFFPKVDYEDVKSTFWGAGIQHDFTELLPADNVWPIHLSAFIGYTSFNGSFDFTDSQIIEGTQQRFDVDLSSWLFQLQASTKLPVINFYGGLGFITGTSDFDVLGTYTVRAGTPITEVSSTFNDPFSVKNKASGIKATLGTRLQLGFFSIYAEYNASEYSTASAGIGFGI